MATVQAPSFFSARPAPQVGNSFIDTILSALQSDPSTEALNLVGPLGLAGVFRDIGLKRIVGELTPEQAVIQMQAQPQFQRFLQLVQGMVRRGLGESFPVFRGISPGEAAALSKADPLATAVSTTKDVAEGFARRQSNPTWAGMTKQPAEGIVLQGQAAPEAVLGLLPKRATGAMGQLEKELLIDPRKLAEPFQAVGRFENMDPASRRLEDAVLNELLRLRSGG